MKTRIMIADDHSMIREAMKQLLEINSEFEVIAQAANGIECLELLKQVEIDVLLLDINMPEMTGLEVLEYFKENGRKFKVIVLTVHNETEYLLKAVDIGIDGYILKESDSSLLKEAINSVLEGKTFIQPELIPNLNSKLVMRTEEQQYIDTLTNRELEVLKLVATGLYNKEIADQLKISERTVKNHIFSIFKKLNVSDRTQAAVFAIRNNLVDIY